MNSKLAGYAVAILLLGIGAGQIYFALRLPGGSLSEPGPGVFPRLIGGLLCAASLGYLVQVFLERNLVALEQSLDIKRPAVLVAALVAFAVLLPRIGFVIPAILLQVLTLQVFGMKGPWRRLAIAATTTAVAVLVFQLLLGVRFPEPSWRF